MNSSDGSLEDGPSIVTKAFPGISLIVPGHFYWFGRIKVESVSVVSVSVPLGVCEDRSKRSISRGLFCTLQAVRLLIKVWIRYLDG